MTITKEQIREAGGIVHSDGNIFFTNIQQLEALIAKSAVSEPVAQSTMTAHRAQYFMERFKREEKLLGPNEQAALDFVIAMLEATPADAASEPVALPLESSQEANDAIEAMLKEYNYPANPQNAGRAGWKAARLYTTPPAAAVSEPVKPYWMIECSHGFTGWWTGKGDVDCRKFDTDPAKGKRFATKQDAEAAIQNSCQIATEHIDVFTPPAEAKREPLTKTRIGNYLRKCDNGDVSMYQNGFKDGVRFAEAAHGIVNIGAKEQ